MMWKENKTWWWWARTWCLRLKVFEGFFKQLQTVKDRPNSPASTFTLKQACEDLEFWSQLVFTVEDDGRKAKQLGDSRTSHLGGSTSEKSKTKQSTSCSVRPGRSSQSRTLFGHSSGGAGTQGWLPEASEHMVTHACTYTRTICNGGNNSGN